MPAASIRVFDYTTSDGNLAKPETDNGVEEITRAYPGRVSSVGRGQTSRIVLNEFQQEFS